MIVSFLRLRASPGEKIEVGFIAYTLLFWSDGFATIVMLLELLSWETTLVAYCYLLACMFLAIIDDGFMLTLAFTVAFCG